MWFGLFSNWLVTFCFYYILLRITNRDWGIFTTEQLKTVNSMHLEKGKELKQVKGDGRPFKYTHKFLGTNEINIKYQIIIFRS